MECFSTGSTTSKSNISILNRTQGLEYGSRSVLTREGWGQFFARPRPQIHVTYMFIFFLYGIALEATFVLNCKLLNSNLENAFV